MLRLPRRERGTAVGWAACEKPISVVCSHTSHHCAVAGYLFTSLVHFSSSSELSPSALTLQCITFIFPEHHETPLFFDFYLWCPWLPGTPNTQHPAPRLRCLASAPGVGLLWKRVPATVKASAFPSWSLGGLKDCCLPPGHRAWEAPMSDKQECVFVTKSGVWLLTAQKPVERPG